MKRPDSKIEHKYKNSEDAYQSGKEAGINWINNWLPNGPWIFTGHSYQFKKDDFKDDEKYSRLCNKEWLRGWEETCQINFHKDD